MSSPIAETLTDDVVASAAGAKDARSRAIFASLVRHLHAFVRDVELTPDEWLAGITFLTATGHKSDDVRQEFILLSDVLGVSMLVDAIASRSLAAGTESTVLGPFFTTDAPEIPQGASIATEGTGVPLDVNCTLRDPDGKPIADATIEVWEVDGNGMYDVQYADREQPNCRARIRSDEDGRFAFRATLPISYSIPGDGPVGELLARLGRHTMRPAHLHFMFTAPGFAPLVTALYVAGDPYIDGDAVFGVKPSLIAKFETKANEDGPFATLQHDFVLVPARERVAS
jgi:protocatechuate 3,4-dioxygenase beta subunit